MRYGSTVLFVGDVKRVLDFYEAAFGLEIAFFDPDFGFGELKVDGGSIGVSSHESGERMMPGQYRRPSGAMPRRMARTKSASVQWPIPTSASGLMFGA